MLSLGVRTAVAVSLFTTGCLSNTYRIPRAELARLTETEPEHRGERLHVVQELGTERAAPTPPPPPPPPAAYTHTNVVILHDGFGGGGPRYAAPARPVTVAGPVTAAPRTVPDARPVTTARPVPGWKTSPTGGGASMGRSGSSGNAEGLVVLGVAVVAAAAFSAVGLAASEGMRYDGHVRAHPHHPVVLEDRFGRERVTTLSALTAADVEASEKALLVPTPGVGFTELGRRPLDRQGGAFKLSLGILQSQPADAPAQGFASDIQIGYFATRWLGILASGGVAWGTDDDRKAFARHRIGLELQAIPLSLGPVHLGGFVHGGTAFLASSAGDRNPLAVGGGGLLEIELSTRLALQGRVDVTVIDPAEERDVGTAFTAGLAIY